ncbi:MAG: ABC transporter permease [Lachnospiraceae bacterium]|nr:ABC transporter permease [Lachnospiraceae bacterium]
MAFYVGLIALWQLLYTASTDWFSWAKPYAIPHPSGVWKSITSLVSNGTLQTAIVNSMLRVLIGFLIACLIGIILGILIINSEYLARNLKPLILGVQTLPSICWVPFAILWFGLNQSAIIFVVVMGSAFGIALAVENGIKNVPPLYIKAAKTMGVSSKNLYLHVIFPAALPSFVAGLKQGWSFAWRALMSGEVMSNTVGLGYTLTLGRDLADINQVMTVMLVIILIGILIDKGIFTTLENHILRKRGLL